MVIPHSVVRQGSLICPTKLQGKLYMLKKWYKKKAAEIADPSFSYYGLQGTQQSKEFNGFFIFLNYLFHVHTEMHCQKTDKQLHQNG